MNSEAVFVSLQSSLAELRFATKKAMLNNVRPQKFTIIEEEVFFFDAFIDQLLQYPAKLAEAVNCIMPFPLESTNETFGCVCFRSSQSHQGCLLHFSSSAWHCAYQPVLSSEVALQEYNSGALIESLSKLELIKSVHRPVSIQFSSNLLSDILAEIAVFLKR